MRKDEPGPGFSPAAENISGDWGKTAKPSIPPSKSPLKSIQDSDLSCHLLHLAATVGPESATPRN